MFRIEKFHVEFQLELYQVLRFRSIFTQNCVHFIVTYHVFLIQYPTSSVSYNISLESSLHIYASFEQIWILHFVKSNILGGHLRVFNQYKLVSEIKNSGFKFLSSEKFHSIHSPYWWLRCLFWKSQETNFLVKIYKKLLEYHILKKPLFLDIIDKSLNPIMGKRFAMYFEKL